MRYRRRDGTETSRASNPMMNDRVFEHPSLAGVSEAPMTIGGTIGKTALLLACLLPTAVVGWIFPNQALMIGSFVVAFVLALVIGFVPRLAPALSIVYALVKGYALGAVSLVATIALQGTQYAAAVPIAASATLITLGVMLALYASRIIRVTETFRSVIIGLTLAVALFYLFGLVMSLFIPGFASSLAPHQAGPIGILFSVFVIGVAAFNFMLDFDFIERGVQSGAPKSMEWYAAFGMTVTIVWLYVEFLRLLMKLGSNR